MRGWMTALPLVAIGVALCSDAVARAVVPAPTEASDGVQRTKPEEHKHHRRFTHARRAFAQQQHAKPAPRTPDVDEKVPTAVPRLLSPQAPVPQERAPVPQEEVRLQSPTMPSLQPRTVPTVRISGATPEAPEAEDAPVTTASVDTGAARRVDPNTALANLLAAADTIDAAAPAAESDAPSTSTAMKLLAVFGVCASVAGGCLGLVALNARRRRGTVLAPSRRTASRPLPARDDRLTQRVAQQRLFPHQFGAAIRSERA